MDAPRASAAFRHLADPDSAVSQLIAERGGYDLMPEMGCKPVNKYLPPRRRPVAATPTEARRSASGNGALRWIDRVLSR